MALPLTLPVTVAALLGGAFLMNETTHGVVSDMMGLGHHHMFDARGYHCGPHDNSTLADHHRQHMHALNGTVPHDACPGAAEHHRGGMHR